MRACGIHVKRRTQDRRTGERDGGGDEQREDNNGKERATTAEEEEIEEIWRSLEGRTTAGRGDGGGGLELAEKETAAAAETAREEAASAADGRERKHIFYGVEEHGVPGRWEHGTMGVRRSEGEAGSYEAVRPSPR